MWKYPDTRRQDYPGGPLLTETGSTFTYTYDTMARLNGMTHINPETSQTVTDASSVVYGAAGQMLEMSSGGAVESRTYNNLLQLTRIQRGTTVNLEYRYSLAQNDGRITQMKN